MSDRPNSSGDDAERDATGADDASSDHEYQAPTLYESSDFLAKYRAEPTTDAPAGQAADLTSSSESPFAGASTSDDGEYTISFDEEPAGTDSVFGSRDALDRDERDELDVDTVETSETDEGDVASAGEGTDVGADVVTDVDADASSADTDADELRTERDTETATVTSGVDERSRGDGTSSETRLGDATTPPADLPDWDNDTSGWREWKESSETASGAGGESEGEPEASDTEAKPKVKFGLIVWSIVVLTLAFFPLPWVFWPLAIIVLIFGIASVRSKEHGSIGRGLTAIVLVGISVAISVFGFIANSDFDTSSFIEAEETLDVDSSPTVEGSGNARLDLVLPNGASQLAVIDVSFTGDRIRVYEADEEGETYGSIFSAYSDGGSGLVPINGDPERPTVSLEIEAEGDWSVTLSGIETLRTFDASVSGTGDDLVYFYGEPGDAVFEMSADDSVTVMTYGTGDPWRGDFRDITSFTQPWDGPRVVQIEADEAWSITVAP